MVRVDSGCLPKIRFSVLLASSARASTSEIGDSRKDFVLYGIRSVGSIPNPIQAEVRRDPVKQTGRMIVSQTTLSAQHLDEDVLGNIQCLVVISQQLRQRRMTIGPYRL